MNKIDLANWMMHLARKLTDCPPERLAAEAELVARALKTEARILSLLPAGRDASENQDWEYLSILRDKLA